MTDEPTEKSEKPSQPLSKPAFQDAAMSPGDQAAPGTPGTGENLCRDCRGTGRRAGGDRCPTCGGTGRVTEGISAGP